MKLGSIGRSLMRLFGGTATQGPPKEPPPKHADLEALVMEIIADAMKKKEAADAVAAAQGNAAVDGLIKDIIAKHGQPTSVKVMHQKPDGTVEDVSDQYLSGKDKPASNDDELPDGGMRPVAWTGWANNVGVLERDGWAPARFPVRVSVDKGIFVNGLVRAPFGIWLSPFPVCDDSNEDQAVLQLATMTHLHSGLAIGVFLSVNDAVAAAEAAVAVVPEHIWRANDPNETGDPAFMELLNRTISAWSFRGIRVSSTRHAHAPDHFATRLNIFECIDPSTDKPETPLS